MTEKQKPKLDQELFPGFCFRDVYEDGTLILQSKGRYLTAWLEPEGDVLVLGNRYGEAEFYVPLKLIDAMREIDWGDGAASG